MAASKPFSIKYCSWSYDKATQTTEQKPFIQYTTICNCFSQTSAINDINISIANASVCLAWYLTHKGAIKHNSQSYTKQRYNSQFIHFLQFGAPQRHGILC